MRTGFGLACPAQELFSYSARGKQFGFFAQALRLFGQTDFKRLDLFETATPHNATSVLTGPNRRVQHFNRNMPMSGRRSAPGPKISGAPLKPRLFLLVSVLPQTAVPDANSGPAD
jgi:hypothetical protein